MLEASNDPIGNRGDLGFIQLVKSLEVTKLGDEFPIRLSVPYVVYNT